MVGYDHSASFEPCNDGSHTAWERTQVVDVDDVGASQLAYETPAERMGGMAAHE